MSQAQSNLWRDVFAGVAATCVSLPLSISAAVLIYAPLGASYIAQGAIAGLFTAIIVGIIYATLATSSFVIISPLASTAIILTSLSTGLMEKATFAADPRYVILAIVLCVFIAGLIQIVFGLLDVGRIIKFTPHSVIAGFVNSVGLLILLSQFRPFVRFDGGSLTSARIDHPLTLIFIVAIAASIIVFRKFFTKMPAPLAGLIGGALIYHVLNLFLPSLDLGGMIGTLPITIPLASSPFHVGGTSAWSALLSVTPHLLLVSLTLATVATLQSLLAFRVARNLGDLPPQPPSDLIVLGLGNCASALGGGIISLPSTAALSASFRAGGRTRLVGLTEAVVLLLIVALFSSVLAWIPVAVLSGILVYIAIHIFDRWTLQLVAKALVKSPSIDRRYAWQSLLVIVIVMIMSVGSSIVAGVGAGFALSCLIFIVNMSRPIVRRKYFGDQIFSKRIRPTEDAEMLLAIGRKCVVFELQGVLFFGNADDLSNLVTEALKESECVLLDMRGISDVDVSGAVILGNLQAAAKRWGQVILFCNLPPGRFDGRVLAEEAIFPDRDSALEWMEEEALRTHAVVPRGEAIPLDALDLTQEFNAEEVAVLTTVVLARDFSRGEEICSEGQQSDRMWILTKGTVSVRLRTDGGYRRIASLAAGTTVGEMALLNPGLRSATVTADEDVSAYELTQVAFNSLLEAHPQIGLKLLKYFAFEMAHRLRLTHRDLRVLRG